MMRTITVKIYRNIDKKKCQLILDAFNLQSSIKYTFTENENDDPILKLKSGDGAVIVYDNEEPIGLLYFTEIDLSVIRNYYHVKKGYNEQILKMMNNALDRYESM